MSPVLADPQFQTTAPRISNLDRCNVCGRPRSAHDFDFTCPDLAAAIGRRRYLAFVVGATVLALAGIGLLTASSTTSTTLGTLLAAGLLTGLTLLISAFAATGHR
jgi:hypothetical protein